MDDAVTLFKIYIRLALSSKKICLDYGIREEMQIDSLIKDLNNILLKA